MSIREIQVSATEENYLKAIFKLSEKDSKTVSTNGIATLMCTSAASVTDMLKRLAEKSLIHYEKYKGVRLSESGREIATHLIRKHRLWETFLVEKLDFSWDEVHVLAEQLEHIQSVELVNRLEAFLEFPKFDPHGDPIPDKHGNFQAFHQAIAAEMKKGQKGIVVGVKEHGTPFLKYVEKLKLTLGTTIEVIERFDYDQSVNFLVNDKFEQTVSAKVCNNLYVNLVQ